MNKLKASGTAKVFAALLLIIMLGALALSVLGIGLLENFGAYGGNLEKTKTAVLQNICDERSYGAIRQYSYDGADPEYIYPDSGFCFIIKDDTGKVLFDSLKGRRTQVSTETVPYPAKAVAEYYVTDNDGLEVAVTSPSADSKDEAAQRQMITLTGYMLADIPADDAALVAVSAAETGYAMRYGLFVIAAVALVLAVLLFVFLLSAAGHRPGTEEIKESFIDRIPFDIFTGLIVLAEFCIGAFTVEVLQYMESWVVMVPLACLSAAVFLLVLLLWCMSWAVRIKLRKALKSCVCYRIVAWLWRIVKRFLSFVKTLFKGLPLIPKAALIAGGVLLVEFIYICAAGSDAGVQLFGWFIDRTVLTALTLYTLLCMKLLLKAGKEIASGNMSYTVDSSRMYGPLKEHAQSLNSITAGLNKAVGERMKSERFKTELITNVSHDIKTPLTSIINYVDLMEKEEPESEKMREYLEVLSRQSARLKKLIDDLMDASKASTGNLSVTLAPCELGVLLEQCAGEYGEKLLASELELVVNKPEGPVMIMADGRHMWRILDNLLNNVCKYAQKGTRVYLSLEKREGKALVTLRNISASMLNISGDELMERFVRGDVSRSTEGSGLGLNIAKSLTELQKGELTITVDGDLFKVTLSFDTVKE